MPVRRNRKAPTGIGKFYYMFDTNARKFLPGLLGIDGKEVRMEQIETMTVEEATEKLRSLGMKISPTTLRDGMAQGQFPFGS